MWFIFFCNFRKNRRIRILSLYLFFNIFRKNRNNIFCLFSRKIIISYVFHLRILRRCIYWRVFSGFRENKGIFTICFFFKSRKHREIVIRILSLYLFFNIFRG